MSASNRAEYLEIGETANISEDPTLAPESKLLEVLHAADKIDSGHWRMRCPAHQGEMSSSLEVSLEAGRFRLVCACGCTTDEILHAAVEAAAKRREEIWRGSIQASASTVAQAAPRPARPWIPKIPPRQGAHARKHHGGQP
jgi:hypothetical protein